MSCRPHAFAAFCATVCGAFTALAALQPYVSNFVSSLPKLYFDVDPARHAYSHSFSVGSAPLRPFSCSRAMTFIFSKNFCVSSQLTPSTGMCGTLIDIHGFDFITAPHWACVSSVVCM